MDYFSHHDHVLYPALFTYDKRKGTVDVSKDDNNMHRNSMEEDGDLIKYHGLYFEHSDTCPSRRNRQIAA